MRRINLRPRAKGGSTLCLSPMMSCADCGGPPLRNCGVEASFRQDRQRAPRGWGGPAAASGDARRPRSSTSRRPQPNGHAKTGAASRPRRPKLSMHGLLSRQAAGGHDGGAAEPVGAAVAVGRLRVLTGFSFRRLPMAHAGRYRSRPPRTQRPWSTAPCTVAIPILALRTVRMPCHSAGTRPNGMRGTRPCRRTGRQPVRSRR